MTHDDTILDMRGIDKRFPGVQALSAVDFDVRRGEVHALIGGNGAGKSTLIKVLTGVHTSDGGTIQFEGRSWQAGSPADAVRGGISTIYQEVNLVPTLSVAENLLLGRTRRRWFGIDWRATRRRAGELLGSLGIDVDVTRPVGSFPVGLQQMVSVARAVNTDARLMVMDEPTSSLDRQETERFFHIVERLKHRGISVIFVTHFLDQVYRISDRITVLRNGRRVGVFNAGALPKIQLVAHMLGRDPNDVSVSERKREEVRARRRDGISPRTVLRARGLYRRNAVEPVDLQLRVGQVYGIAGLLGSGRTELARLLAGADRPDGGTIRLDDRAVKLRKPRSAICVGIVMTPEDRQVDGLIPDLSVRENVVLGVQPRLSRFGRVSRKVHRRIADEFVQRLGISTPDLETPVRNLSGGNQQKVILARWLACKPRVLILDEPTRGIDVGAKAEIERLVHSLCRRGLSLVFISAELDEVARMSDDVLVLRERRPVGELHGPDVNEPAIMSAIAGDEDGPDVVRSP
ncbi:MAG: sugar ABC transporter ATP-binding protein [Phycisphaerales bacterium]|nr:MAG: sugar ABC transporter ATP-binding protein [Phycisphaerales bacterium]